MGIFSKLKKKPAEDKAEKKPVKKSEAKVKDEVKKEKVRPEAKKEAKKVEEKKEEKEAKPAADKGKGKKAAKPKKIEPGPLAKEGAGHAYRILIRPVLTEKADHQQALNKYTFIVARDANKVMVAEAVRDLYGVKPTAVQVLNLKGKRVRFGRLQGRRKGLKKAVVTLKQGDAITFTE